MATLLAKNATVLVTMNEQREEIHDGGLFARDGWIEQVGPSQSLPASADEVLDLTGQIVIPGLINTHHHFYQTLTRVVAQNAPLVRVVDHVVPDLGPVDARRYPHFDLDGSGRVGHVGMYHLVRSPLPLPERFKTRRRYRTGSAGWVCGSTPRMGP